MKHSYFQKYTSAAPLAVFRVFFGIIMFLSLARFWSNGWIEKLYLTPQFHFSYYGFEWVKPLGNFTYILFVICMISTIFIMVGYQYKTAIIVFFISFTYIELMDKTTYLNHYYFTSVLSFLMIFLPCNARFSVDNYAFAKAYKQVPNWTIDSIKLLLALVYFYAGLAKINSDWIVRASPLNIWLPSKYDIPFFGDGLLQQSWVHHLMSWSGMLYDLAIPFLLLYRKTRVAAFIAVVIFHVSTSVLFPIGMFPYIMIISTLIFFDERFHERIITLIKQLLKPISSLLTSKSEIITIENFQFSRLRVTQAILIVFFAIQIILPWRYLLYPGELFWTEEGYRFSWRVMLMEKLGYAQFKVVDKQTGTFFYVNNSDFLTPFQEKQMSSQPDFILEYAHYLGDHFTKQGHKNIQVFVDCSVTLNGRPSAPFINNKTDLYKINESFKHKHWILPFHDTIKGF